MPNARTLRVGVDHSPPPPLNFGLPGSQDFKGFEVDLTSALAARLHVRVEFRSALWRILLNELGQGALDMVCTAVTVTPARRELLDFSDPYLDTQLAIVARADRPVRNVEDLAALVTAVRVVTVAEDHVRLRVPAARLRAFDLNTEVYGAVSAGHVDAALDDLPIATYFVRQFPGLAEPVPIPGTDAQYAYAFAKGSEELRKAVNDGLRGLKNDGTRRTLRDKWWPPSKEAKDVD
jgi:ABC-type amino acid transport substrate-binding protein